MVCYHYISFRGNIQDNLQNFLATRFIYSTTEKQLYKNNANPVHYPLYHAPGFTLFSIKRYLGLLGLVRHSFYPMRIPSNPCIYHVFKNQRKRERRKSPFPCPQNVPYLQIITNSQNNLCKIGTFLCLLFITRAFYGGLLRRSIP